MNETWLAHHGILGQKWGIRRFQNKDGTLTEAGKKHAKTNEDEEDTKKKQAKERMNYALVSGGIFAGVSAIKSTISIAARNKGLKYMSDGQLKLNIGLESAKAAVRAGRAFVLGGAAGYVAEGIKQGRSNNLYANPQYRPAGTMIDGPTKIKQPKGAISMR